jgi:hypothetical protein
MDGRGFLLVNPLPVLFDSHLSETSLFFRSFLVSSSVHYPDESVEKTAINHRKISQIWL